MKPKVPLGALMTRLGMNHLSPPTSLLSPTSVSGPIRSFSPSPPEQGQGFPSRALGPVDAPTPPPPSAEPVVVSFGDCSYGAGGSNSRLGPGVARFGPVAQPSSSSSYRKKSRDSPPQRLKGTAEMVKIRTFDCSLTCLKCFHAGLTESFIV